MKKQHLRHEEAADYLGIKPKTLSGYATKNIIPRQKPTPGIVYYLKKDLDVFIRSNRIESTTEPVKIENKK
jgi:DNA-binding transcriptional MerR regulator